jgi:hypothetical protein
VRLISFGLALAVAALAAVVLGSNAFRPAPAATRLAGVGVSIAGYTIEDLAAGRHRLRLSVSIGSARDLDDCIGFTLDEPFARRRLDPPAGACVKPRTGSRIVQLVTDHLTDDDLAFPSHTLVWGIPGGRCGPILELFGVCVVDMAGTTALELPAHSVLPSLGPLGSFFPLFSFPAP